MARKDVPKPKLEDLYEEKVVYLIDFVDGAIYGRWLAAQGTRCQAVSMAKQFEDYDAAHQYIVQNCLEGVGVTKVWV